jgi:choline dehydrogenase
LKGSTPTIVGGRRADVALSYLFNNSDRRYPNLTITVNAEATKLLLDDDKSQVIGADFSSGHSIYGKEVIVSCGAIKSPHLLLLLGVGF